MEQDIESQSTRIEGPSFGREVAVVTAFLGLAYLIGKLSGVA